jgi:hypothetical protein
MSNNLFNTSSEFGEVASQVQGGRPISDFSSISESPNDGHGSQQLNLDNIRQPKSSENSESLFEALQRPLMTLSQSQEVLMAQLKVLNNKVADIQLNQNSILMNTNSSTSPSKSVVSSSVSSSKNLFHAIDTRARDLHRRVFQNIGSCVKPAYHKKPVLTGFACIDDYTPEYIPDVNTDIPLSLATSNVPSGPSSFAQ